MVDKVISIIIPTYNSDEYLEQTLLSIFNQKYNKFEVIIVDSNSTDCTHTIVDAYKKQFPDYVKLLLMPKDGQVRAINYGLSEAKGDILTYINSDDVYSSNNSFWFASSNLDRHDIGWCYGDGFVVDGNGLPARSIVTKFKSLWWRCNSSRVLFWFDYIVQPTVFFTRKLWETVGEFNPDYPLCFDYDYWLRASQVCKPIYIPFHIADWRAHRNAISVKNTNAQIDESVRINSQYAVSIVDRVVQNSIALAEKIVYKVIS